MKKAPKPKVAIDESLYTSVAFAKLCYICDYKVDWTWLEEHKPEADHILKYYRNHQKCITRLKKMLGIEIEKPKPESNPRSSEPVQDNDSTLDF